LFDLGLVRSTWSGSLTVTGEFIVPHRNVAPSCLLNCCG